MIASPIELQAPEMAQFAQMLEEGGMTLTAQSCAPERLRHLVGSMQDEIGCVVLTGGDAKLGSAAIALRESGLPVGILPLGRGDEVAGWLGIPSDPAAAAGLILAGYRRSLDLNVVNGQPFFGMASIGLTLEDARALGRAADQRMGQLAYVLRAARVMLRARRFAAIIRCGSAIYRVRTVQITVGRGDDSMASLELEVGHLGEGPILYVYSLEPAGRGGVLRLRHAFRSEDGAKVPEARYARAPVVEIVTRLPRPITADGAVIAITPARFTILPRAVDVFVPAPMLP